MGCTKDGSELAKSWQTQIHEHALLRLVLLLYEDASDSSKTMHRHRWDQSVKHPLETPQRLLFIDPDRSIRNAVPTFHRAYHHKDHSDIPLRSHRMLIGKPSSIYRVSQGDPSCIVQVGT